MSTPPTCGNASARSGPLRTFWPAVTDICADWKKLPLTDLTRSMVRAKHQELTVERGKVTANHVMRDFRAAYNLALRVIDDPDQLPGQPGRRPSHSTRSGARTPSSMPDDLADWWEKIQALPSPLRRMMHELGIYSGLRPGTLVSLRREWIDLDNRAISHSQDEVGPLV